MKVLDMIIDTFWVCTLIWAALCLWVWSGIYSPIIVKDVLYAITDVMDYWLYVNAVLGTVRFILNLVGNWKKKRKV